MAGRHDDSADNNSHDSVEPLEVSGTHVPLDATREYDPEAHGQFTGDLLLNEIGIQDSSVRPPSQLGKYAIHGQIGYGGMGIVLKAFDPDLQRTVAIKILKPHLAESPVARRRFQREARAAAAISHPNVLTIHSVEEQGETPFLVMEFVSGQSLKEYVHSRGKLDAVEVIRLSAQIAQGLAAAHAQGVIHRDVKPANVMMHEGGTRVRLTDFGLARVAFDNSDLTSHDHAVGTPAYMAPEQVRGHKVDSRADLFSLGCVMYFMVTGHSPFHGKTHAETIHKIIDLVPPLLHEVNPGVPHVLSEMVEKLLAKEPDYRYQKSSEVADDLRRLMVQLNQAPTEEIDQVLADRTPAPVAPSQEAKAEPSATPHRGRVSLLVSVVIALTGLGTWSYWPDVWRWASPSAVTPAANQGTSGNGDAVPLVPKLTEITVGPGSGATCATLSEAIQRADENCIITVIGPGPFEESVTVQGSALDGLTLKASPRATWRCPVGNDSETHALLLKDVSHVEIDGFDFEVLSERGRAAHLMGTVGDVSITDCGFRHTLPAHKLSLVNLGAAGQIPESRIVIQQCRFTGAAGPCYCLAIDSKERPGPQVVCENCLFESEDKHLFVARSCPQFRLSGAVFVNGHTGLLLDFKPWTGDERFEIYNNTFVGTRFWFSWMDSVPAAPVRSTPGDSYLCNNLILGGERTLGKPEQWDAMLAVWKCQSNWWERDGTTTASADRDGRLATMKDDLSVPVRRDPTHAEFLVPAADSPLLTSGVGGDLPTSIGAKRSKP